MMRKEKIKGILSKIRMPLLFCFTYLLVDVVTILVLWLLDYKDVAYILIDALPLMFMINTISIYFINGKISKNSMKEDTPKGSKKRNVQS